MLDSAVHLRESDSAKPASEQANCRRSRRRGRKHGLFIGCVHLEEATHDAGLGVELAAVLVRSEPDFDLEGDRGG